RKVGPVARVAQLVHHRDPVRLMVRIGAVQHGAHVVRADEPGAAGDQQPHVVTRFSSTPTTSAGGGRVAISAESSRARLAYDGLDSRSRQHFSISSMVSCSGVSISPAPNSATGRVDSIW